MRDLIDRMYARLFVSGEKGQGMLEYGLIITFVALVVVAALTLLGPKVANIYNEAGNQLQ